MALLSPLLALAATALIAALLFAALGKDPVRGLAMFFVEPFSNLRQITGVVLKATPLIVIALGLALCYRSNVWNIGAEGQFLLGLVGGGGVALWLTTQGIAWPRAATLPLVLGASVLGGMAWAAITALLRDRFNASEILVSLMLVYVAQQFVNYLVFGPWKDPLGFNFPQTKNFDASTWLPLLLPGTRLNIGIVIALALAALTWVFLFRLFRGFQLQVGGLAPAAARYAGFSSRSALWSALLISGGLAGLAGGIEAIRMGLPNAITGVFQGLLLVLLLACDTLIHFRVRLGAGLRARSARVT